ncbi:hypothetical protein HMPREF9104_01269 [Lentilactobacillus kisonensis F0435]|uniref:Uncharacterized protein n=1 Tax=Lentilactobacillus kisonensis F0435 TaxID=797516 RepID=H1LF93_9LACO|nr:hypothetical protein HMPREF9104_01269 [Lentilactobacillus kisonensis F0435]
MQVSAWRSCPSKVNGARFLSGAAVLQHRHGQKTHLYSTAFDNEAQTKRLYFHK